MTLSVLDRRDVLKALFPDPEGHLFVAGLAGSGRDAAALTQEGDNLFALGGAMGGAVAMGLGVALTLKEKSVAVITGDGELLMNVGALATVASAMPGNLTVVCIDNGLHGETGGQPGHTARRTNLAVMAEGAGFPSVMTLENSAAFDDARRFLAEAAGPRFLWARVKPGPSAAFARNWNMAERRIAFRNARLGRRTLS